MKLTFSRIFLLVILVLTHFVGSLAQSFDIPSQEDMEAIFDQFADTNAPGIAAAVMYKGEVVFTKTFGKANLESGAPITANTSFQLAEISGQFTAFALLQLEEAGQLSLEDNLQSHLPELPDFAKRIKLKHLLSHSHGLHAIRPLRWLAGWSVVDMFAQEQAIRLLSTQKELSFEPGSSFSYSDTPLILVTEVIERITGKSLAEYAKESIFQPLGMADTYYQTNHDLLSPNKAMAYRPTEDGYQNAISTYRIIGPMNLYSSINDLMIWEQNLNDPTLGSTAIYRKLKAVVTLDDGTPYNQSAGKLTYGQRFIHKERGIPKSYQTGYTAGFATAIWRFESQDFTAVTLTNTGETYTGYLGMQLAHLFLEEKFIEPATTDFTKLGGPKLKTSKLEDYTGNYWDQVGGLARSIAVVDDTLRYIRSPQNQTALIPSGKDEFQLMFPYDDKVFVNFSGEPGNRTMEYLNGESNLLALKEYEPVAPSLEELSTLTGLYHCPLLNVSMDMTIKNGALVLSNIKIGDITLSPIKKDLFAGDQWSMRAIKILRSSSEDVSGFEVSYNEIRSLVFDKI